MSNNRPKNSMELHANLVDEAMKLGVVDKTQVAIPTKAGEVIARYGRGSDTGVYKVFLYLQEGQWSALLAA